MITSVFQESPTGELADYTFSTGTEASGVEVLEEKNLDQLQPGPEVETQSSETCCDSDEVEGNNSREG